MEKAGSQRLNTRDLTTQVREICEQFECPEPGPFLAHIMAGNDPRSRSELLALLQNIVNKRRDRGPSRRQWEEICDLVDNLPSNFEFVNQATSIDAARKLLEYLYAKQKAVEFSGTVSAAVGHVDKMSKKEIMEFVEKYENDY